MEVNNKYAELDEFSDFCLDAEIENSHILKPRDTLNTYRIPSVLNVPRSHHTPNMGNRNTRYYNIKHGSSPELSRADCNYCGKCTGSNRCSICFGDTAICSICIKQCDVCRRNICVTCSKFTRCKCGKLKHTCGRCVYQSDNICNHVFYNNIGYKKISA